MNISEIAPRPTQFGVKVTHLCITDGLGMFVSEWGDRLYNEITTQLDSINLAANLRDIDPLPTTITVTKILPSMKMKAEFASANPLTHAVPDCGYQFNFIFPYDDFELKCQKHFEQYGNKSQSRLATNRFYATMANSYTNRLIILLNIIAPGFCDSSACVIETSGDFNEIGDAISNHSYEAFFDQFYVPFGIWRDLNIQDVVKWSSKISGFWTGTPETNLERSLCYFSYLFPSEKSDGYFSTAVWAFGALDAIFSDSHVATLEKLKRRTGLILNEMGFLQNIKAINFLYNDRSRTFHGNMKFGANYSDPYGHGKSDRHDKGVYDSITTAMFLLITTFRYAAENQTSAIDFREILELGQ